jgi:glycosyltransferase involved in cell wall biosynthesis
MGLARTGGSENFTYAMIEELLRLKHDVECFTFIKGKDANGVSQRVEALGVPFMRREAYDLILASGNNTVRHLSPRGFVIDTMHGVLPGVEEPSAFADLYVSVSPYIRDYYRERGFQSKVIMNGINCRRFRPLKELNKRLTRYCHCAKGMNQIRLLRVAARKWGLGLRSSTNTLKINGILSMTLTMRIW